ncbi:MAG: MFS transporter [Verrucomicrobiota bacterium]|nr:MFS transporter [Verrucomicrobiota bacterium]
MNSLIEFFRRRVVDVRPNEWSAMWLAFVFNFVVLAGYYILRPIREEIGATSGIENLPWMYTATLTGMLIANALFAAIASRMPRRKFLPIAYRFAILNLFIFFILLRFVPANWQWLLARSFFVWVSVFNLFATTLFWAFMTDLFTAEQGKRLFGFIAVGGSLGAILGPLVPTFLVNRFSTGIFCLMSAVMFEIAAQCVRFFPTEIREQDQTAAASAEKPLGGNIWDSFTHVCRWPYLFVLALFLFIYTLTNTWANFQQVELTQVLTTKAARTEYFGKLDFSVNTLTVLIQLFLTSRLLKWTGVGFTLVLMPALSGIGFLAIGYAPVLAVLAVFQVVRRATGFALLRPAREILFTVLKREDKYKAKSFIDTFGYRAGDQVGAWSYKGLSHLGFDVRLTSYLAVPLIAFWCGLSFWLGRKQIALARARDEATR